jgi:hypothetical protein
MTSAGQPEPKISASASASGSADPVLDHHGFPEDLSPQTFNVIFDIQGFGVGT